jgi:hypothetical protein
MKRREFIALLRDRVARELATCTKTVDDAGIPKQ